MYKFEEITNLVTNDSAQVLLSNCFVYPNQPQRFAEKINQYSQGSKYKTYSIISRSKELLGIIIIEQKDAQTIIIQGIACELTFRNQGIGRKMVNYIIDICQPTTILAETDDDAIDFYKKLGFNMEMQKEKYPENTRYLCKLTLH
ncbi:GNAT family N-acetyltransferase [Enterococcus rivorum]|uniref:N-acetyltransferase domain-containing protein n=1 Tax=Enterococcus rivorum TaxID=762845 RepID=A0A1E5KTG0_9ENTE|nr:GNAT family N-acetyltransferase [Enterococcus rivorum]MBP2100714.1 ribosomal protein S18 acetylase RimI-like enzyme [Enterococcus rivorum]OEH81150.1 hypothetical protein BCR26_17370 [Enterococcus rivorum]